MIKLYMIFFVYFSGILCNIITLKRLGFYNSMKHQIWWSWVMFLAINKKDN